MRTRYSNIFRRRLSITIFVCLLSLGGISIPIFIAGNANTHPDFPDVKIPIVYDAQSEYDKTRDKVMNSIPTYDWSSYKKFHLNIENTSINMDVICTRDPQFYLTHNAKGETYFAGCPFVDLTYPKNLYVTTVYGHSVTGSHIVFSDLKQASIKDEAFSRFGKAILTRRGQKLCYKKLGAYKIDQKDVYLAEPSIKTQQGISEYISRLREKAQVAQEIENLSVIASDIKQLLILITCAHSLPNQPERALILFGATP